VEHSLLSLRRASPASQASPVQLLGLAALALVRVREPRRALELAAVGVGPGLLRSCRFRSRYEGQLGNRRETIALTEGKIDVVARKNAEPDSAIVRWFLRTARDRGIASRVGELSVPALEDSATIRSGAKHYHAMCVECHGGPGVAAGEIGEGLNPEPPKLHELGSFDDVRARRTFWIVKNGIRMTGMPSFGKTHDYEALWAIVAYVRALQGMSPEQFKAHVPEATPGHRHGPDEHSTPGAGRPPGDAASDAAASRPPDAATAPPPSAAPAHKNHDHQH
jgi:mono/diheme cytochrome c family protein